MTATLTAYRIAETLPKTSATVAIAGVEFADAVIDSGVDIGAARLVDWGADGFRYTFADGSALNADVPVRGTDLVVWRATVAYTPRQIEALAEAGLDATAETGKALAVLLRSRTL